MLPEQEIHRLHFAIDPDQFFYGFVRLFLGRIAIECCNLRRVPGSVFISLRKKRRAFRLAAFVSIKNLQSATHLRYLRNQDLPPLELLLDVECKDRQLLSVLLLSLKAIL